MTFSRPKFGDGSLRSPAAFTLPDPGITWEGKAMIDVVDVKSGSRMADYAGHAYLASAVDDLRQRAHAIGARLQGRKVWMVNSTANGGGVAEMLPKLVGLLRELGVPTEWVVVSPKVPDFFALTKRIHNLIHDFGRPGFTPQDAALYDRISRDAARELGRRVAPQDLLVVHDPQPLGAGALLKRRTGVKTIWRCHIGLDRRTRATDSAWAFLRPHAEIYDHAVFSAPEYIPGFLAGKSSVICPAIDPLGSKNRDLAGSEFLDILRRAGLIQNGHHPTATLPWRRQAMRLRPDGSFARAGSGPDLGLPFRPFVAQISRWDRLKGWEYLLEGFLRLKHRYRRPGGGRRPPAQRRVDALMLLLVGPDPAAVQDDPEGKAVLADLCRAFRDLPPEDRESVALLTLPMENREQNHLMVNVIQRCAAVVVQNSIQEGFGLTATEAMWKAVPVLGSSACGLRQQIRPGIDGLLTQNAGDAEEIARNLDDMLLRPANLSRWGCNAKRRVHERFLVFSQAAKWLQCLAETAAGAD
jgi:trehalose synthase